MGTFVQGRIASARAKAARCGAAQAARFLARLLLILLSITGLSCRRGSTDRREVVLYCSVDQAVAMPIVAEFERRSGLKVLARYDAEGTKTVGLVQRLRAEADSPLADVFWSSEIFYTIRLAREGLLAGVRCEATRDWPSRYADPHRRWYGFALRARAIGYSTQRVRPAEAPEKLEDLLERRWKGRIAMASPRFGTTGGDVASWLAHYGPARAREILAGLKANDVRVVDGNSVAVRMVATGEADVCLTDTDDVYVAKRNGWPVAMNYLDQGGEGVLVIPNTVAIIRGAPHPKEAEALLSFLLSEQVEKMLARSDSHNTPIRPSLADAEEFRPYAIGRPLEIDYDKVADALPAAVRMAGEILR